jgi:hypothetical protein
MVWLDFDGHDVINNPFLIFNDSFSGFSYPGQIGIQGRPLRAELLPSSDLLDQQSGLQFASVQLFTPDPVPGVPEPSTWVMLLIGFAAYLLLKASGNAGATSGPIISRAYRTRSV